jgi:hypothetical protein
LGNDHVEVRFVAERSTRAGVFDFAGNVDAINYLAKNNVLVVQKRRGHGGDEELAAIGIGP